MAEYITSVLEIREAGIPVRAQGQHVVRVLGALRERALPARSGAKEALAAADTSALARYLAGELAVPPPDADAPDEPFQVPEAIVTATGEIEFLKRGGAG